MPTPLWEGVRHYAAGPGQPRHRRLLEQERAGPAYMSGMTTFDPTLHPRGHQMNAGAFAERSNSEPETSLLSAPEGSASTALVLPVVTVDTADYDPLSPYPTRLPTPVVSCGWDDGNFEMYARIGDETVSIWRGGGGVQNSLADHDSNGRERLDLTEDEQDQLETWLTEAHDRLNGMVSSVTLVASTAQTQRATLAPGLGQEPASDERPLAEVDATRRLKQLDAELDDSRVAGSAIADRRFGAAAAALELLAQQEYPTAAYLEVHNPVEDDGDLLLRAAATPRC